MHTRCFCDTCQGALVPKQTKQNHQRKQLKTETISGQLQQKRKILSAPQHSAGSSSSTSHLRLQPGVSAPSLVAGTSNDPGTLTQASISAPSLVAGTSNDPGTLTQASILDSELDVFGNVVYDADQDILSTGVDVNPEDVHVREGEYVHEDDDFPDEDALPDNTDLGNEGDHSRFLGSLVSDTIEHDPFVVENCDKKGTAILEGPEIPSHLQAVYTLVTWLHFQFHLPHVACNAVLAFLALLFRFFSTDLAAPFISLPSATRALGVNPGVQLLAVCPGCRGVYPSAGSKHVQEECTLCRIPLFLPDHTRQGNHRTVKTPVIKYPYLPLSEQIVSILKSPGVEALLDEWRTKSRNSGEYGDIFDGRMCRFKLRAPDNSLFFSNHPHESHGPNDELRIGLNMGVDWFSYIRSNIAPSHSSCPTSFSICNLPPEFRYRTSNLICTSILPGPKEQSPDEIQWYLRPIISDLLRLWKDGIVVPTESRPNGRLVRVILVAVVCDKPAAHKIGGFASHSHNNFCTLCWVSARDKARVAAFQYGAFPRRTNEDHRRLGEDYRQLNTPTARKNFVKEHATRYSELSRLPYFDMVEQIVIDPMHNLFLGLVKTHFYGIWVQQKILRPNHELNAFHAILSDVLPFIVPISCGRLPTDIGVPSGGSLTADQWLLLATVYGPIAVPLLWSKSLAEHGDNDVLYRRVSVVAEMEMEKSREDAQKADDRIALAEAKKLGKEAHAAAKARLTQERAAASEAKKMEKLRIIAEQKAEKARLAAETKAKRAEAKGTKRKATSQIVEGILEGEQRTLPPPTQISTAAANEEDLIDTGVQPDKFLLHPSDPSNFLKLCAAIRILLRRRLTDPDIDHADRLLREYCTELISLYGSNVIKPNHHYSTHVSECVRNYGPLHDFWTFLFERLNKVLKSYKTNNHGHGELETTFFSDFQKTCHISRLTYNLLRHPKDSLPHGVAEVMLRASGDERGTVAGLAALSQALDDEHAEGCVTYALSPRRQVKGMSSETYRLLAHAICVRYPATPVHCRSDRASAANSLPLQHIATFFEYVVVNGKRFFASRTVGWSKSSLVHVVIPGPIPKDAYGEVLEILQVDQDFRNTGLPLWFAQMRWFKPWCGERDPIWDKFTDVNVRLWDLGEYQERHADFPAFIDPDWIKGHLAMTTVSIGQNRTKVWATIDLAK